MFTRTFSATHLGLEGALIEIEVVKQAGLAKIVITGLAGEVVRESRERIGACLQNLGFDSPSCRIIVHLSPAQAKKQGSQLDLAITIGILQAEGFLGARSLSSCGFVGEIALDGQVRSIARALPLLEVLAASDRIEKIFVAADNATEAQVVGSEKFRLVRNLSDALTDLRGVRALAPVRPIALKTAEESFDAMDRVLGQLAAKRAMQIAVAGRHHLLMSGPPGVGKSSLAECMPGLFPPLDPTEARDILRIHDHLEVSKGIRRPFRAPHHTISGSALLGGGSGTVIPGEVTLAHHGVLFLDEFPQFRRDLIEGLREPMQTKDIRLHRVGHSLHLPASFLLVAAMNPCPCGLWGDPKARCGCPPERVVQYQQRISGPILERIDLFVFMNREEISGDAPEEFRAENLRRRVLAAQTRQRERMVAGRQTGWNAEAAIDLNGEDPFRLVEEDREWVLSTTKKEQLSLRAVHKWLRIARTIADLETSDAIRRCDLLEAKQLRCRKWWRLGYGSSMN